MLNWITKAMKTLVNILGGLVILIAVAIIGALGLILIFFSKILLIGAATVLMVLVVIGSLFHRDR